MKNENANANVETAEQVAEAGDKVDTQEVISNAVAEGVRRLDFDAPQTIFAVGKTYFGADLIGEWNPNVKFIVKKLTVTKITAKTICTVDETGFERKSHYADAYAGTTQGFTIGTPNGYVSIYAFNEYAPEIAAVPADNYDAWFNGVQVAKADTFENHERARGLHLRHRHI